VLVYHSAYFVQSTRFYGTYGSVAGHILGSTHLGLFVFFALSGYLISRPFVRALVADAPVPNLARYARRRALRIVPAFWAILTIQLVAGGFFGASPGRVVMVYAFAQNFANGAIDRVMNQAWTLDVEVAFYVLVPVGAGLLAFLARSADRRGRLRLLSGAIGGAAILSLAARAFGPHTLAWQTSLPAMLFAFIPGIALAAVEATSVPARLCSMASRVPGALLLSAGLGLLVFYAAGVHASRPPIIETQSLDVLGFLLAACGTGAVVAAARVSEWSSGRSWQILDNRAMRWIGMRSYSLYLVHRVTALGVVVAASDLTLTAGARLALLLPVILAVSLCVAALSYRWFEKPFLDSCGRVFPRRWLRQELPISGRV
jgi:peptidoglycan/LPS O-acetylase OafA/YrhL